MEALKDLPVNVIDLIVISVLLVSAIFAYARGLSHEILSIGGWIGAIFATIYGYPYLKPYSRDLIPIELAADLASGVVIFIFSLTILSLLTRGLSKQIQESSLNVLDRSLGFLFGIVRGAVLVCLAFIGLELLTTRADQPEWLREARSMPLIVKGADWMKTFIPDNVNELIPNTGAQVKAPKVELDAGDVVKQLLTPPARPTASQPDGSYENTQRQSLERLIETTEGDASGGQ